MLTNTITLTFDTNFGNVYTMNVPNAYPDISDEAINESMEKIVEAKIFRNSAGLPIGKRSARLTQTETHVVL